ncbi:hypothetical protein ACIRPX_04135 [Streptomyces sp. NPDC101225]|uniref:hypothetical protein n=1 Tax=Streptomyces sp. NPDC101225 TaxID=3366135 RepID=UPI0038296F75
MSAEAAAATVDAFDVLADHCLACHGCRATPDRKCGEAQQLYRVWKTLWKEHHHGDLREV